MDQVGYTVQHSRMANDSEINCCSPSPQTPNPFHFISSDPAEINKMKQAEKNPQLVMLSDWDHLTAAEYQKVQEDTGVNIV